MSTEDACYPPPTLMVSGGVGGERARTEDLKRASQALERAANEVELASFDIRRAEGLAEAAVADAISEVRPRVIDAKNAVYRARVGVGGFDDAVLELEDAAKRIAAVAAEYEQAEESAYHGVSALTQLGRSVSDLLGLMTWNARSMWGAALTFTPINRASMWATGGDGLAAAIRPDSLPSITGLVNFGSARAVTGGLDSSHGILGTPYTSVLWLLSRASSLLEGWAGEPIYVGVAPLPETVRQPQAQGVADLVMDLNETAVLDHGGVTIDTIEHADGTKSHVVNIPGTDDTTFSNASPRDWNSNFLLLNGEESNAIQMVRDAIEAANIGPDEPLLLQGHSQGGIVATQLAASDFAADYSITHVLTYGSPVGRIPVNTEVEYMHLVTSQDPTGGADASLVTDHPNVTYGELDLLAAPDPAIAQLGTTIAGAHSLNAYKAVGEAVDMSSRPSVTAWRESAASFLGDGEVTRHQFKPTFEEPSATSPNPVQQPIGPQPPPSLDNLF